MITIDYLLEKACEADQFLQANRDTAPSQEKAKAYAVRQEAMAAARWMEEGGLTEIAQVGPFGTKPIQRGATVKIKKGSIILSMHPKYDHLNPKVAGRDYKITVFDVHDGYITTDWHAHHRDRSSVQRPQQIVWAGEGGYWCYLDTKDVELV